MKKIQLLLLMCVAVSCGSSDQTSPIGAADSDTVVVAPIESANSVAPTAPLPDLTEIKKDSAPKTADYPHGIVATMTIDKDKIYLMSDGKVTSSNKNIYGIWSINSTYKTGLVEIYYRNADGITFYAIRENEDAYEIGAGSSIEVSVAGPYNVIVESVEFGDSTIVDFYDLPSIPVTWLRNDIRHLKSK